MFFLDLLMVTLFKVTYKASQLRSNPVTNKASESVFKPVEVVSLPRRSGTLSSSLCTRQQIRNEHSYRPRIPRVLCRCGLSHTRLRSAARGVNLSWRHFRAPCRPHRQSPPEQSTRHHWRWNTIVCSKHGSYGFEEDHSRRHAEL